MNVKDVLLLLNLMILPLPLFAEKALREIDRNGISWMYERGAASVITSIESASNLHKLEFPVELGGKSVAIQAFCRHFASKDFSDCSLFLSNFYHWMADRISWRTA